MATAAKRKAPYRVVVIEGYERGAQLRATFPDAALDALYAAEVAA